MKYSEVEDIQAEFKQLKLDEEDSALTEDVIEDWITQADSEIDTYLAIRYTLPVPDSATKALDLLKMISTLLVSQRVRDKLEVKTVRVEGVQEVRTNSRKDALALLQKISTGELNLIDVPLATSAAGVTSFVSTHKAPRVFHRYRNEW